AQHPFFDQDGGRRIYFEGTYTAEFSGSHEKTPRYDYNQIMYRLDLADPRLALPAPVYRLKGGAGYQLREGVEQAEAVAFFAVPPDRTRDGLVPVYSVGGKLQDQPPAGTKPRPLFLAAADAKAPGVVPLYEYTAGDRVTYSTRAEPPGADWKRT